VTSPTRFVLRRVNWRKAGGGFYDRGVYGWYRLPGTTRLAVFPDADAAEQERKLREGEARDGVNPFRCGTSLADRTSLDEGRLCDWLLDHGLEPPEKPVGRRTISPEAWAAWWDEESDFWDDHQRDKVWEALDRVRFHEVVQEPVRPLVYVVVAIPWHYTDEDFFATEEGGEPRRVFRTRAEAEGFCQGRTAELGSEPADYTGRARAAKDPLDLEQSDEEVWFDGDQAPRYEILEVEVLD
jgi:hypothetical protein